MSFDADDPRKMPGYFFAQDSDLDYGGAVKAKPKLQRYSYQPRLWYIDAWQTCCQCGSQFLFSIKEQRFWYEIRRFYVGSYPTRCKRCRGLQRRIKDVRQQYGDMRKNAIRRDASRATKEEVLKLLDEMESAGASLTARMLQCRGVLQRQIAAIDSAP